MTWQEYESINETKQDLQEIKNILKDMLKRKYNE